NLVLFGYRYIITAKEIRDNILTVEPCLTPKGMKINMYERTCLTRFAVFSTEYEGVLAKQVPEEELIGEPAWYSSNDLIRLQLRKPQENYPEPFLYNPLSQTPNLYLEIA